MKAWEIRHDVLQIAVTRDYLHERYLGRPSCPRCGMLLMASERPEFSECVNGVKSGIFGCATVAIIL